MSRRLMAMPGWHLGFIALALLTGAAQAVCLRAPSSWGEEAREARAVVVGRAVAEQALTEDREDPAGVTAQLYTVKVSKTLRGHPLATFKVWSENSSARFPLDRDVDYLLFLSVDQGGRFYVDSCGHSGPLRDRAGILKQLQRPAA